MEVLAGPGVILVGGPSAAGTTTRWDNEVVAPLASRMGLAVHRVLCLAGYPAALRPLVAARVRSGAKPPGVPVLLDWRNSLAETLMCSPAATTVLLVDRSGREVLRVEGAPDALAADRLLRAAAESLGSDAPPAALEEGGRP
jgi:hypothetical protein